MSKQNIIEDDTDEEKSLSYLTTLIKFVAVTAIVLLLGIGVFVGIVIASASKLLV